MITILFGKTASGKSTILNELVKCGYKKIITYTTRPMRKKEKQNEDYHFISEEEFKKKAKDGFFAEYKSYDTVAGTWYYGSAMEDYTDGSVIILTPDGIKNIKNYFNDLLCIYIYSNNNTIMTRLKKRGDNPAEIARRVANDNRDFSDAANLADKIVYNNLFDNIEGVVNKIKAIINKEELK